MANLESRPGSIEGHTVWVPAEKVNAHQAPAPYLPLHILNYLRFYCSHLAAIDFLPNRFTLNCQIIRYTN